MRIFAGYAGWGAEQLAAEIEEGSWYVVPGEAVDVFRARPGASCGATCCAASPASWPGTRRARDPELN